MTGGDDGGVIEAIELSSRRRGRRALEAVSFQVRPGQVTGLLGLPGSGKTAVLRRMLHIDRGGGRALYDGRPFRSLAYPMRSVGVLLDPLAVHPGRTVAGHLRLALSADPGAAPGGRRERIDAVLDVVGLTDQARTRIFELTEGMTVRLGLAQALLGDPQALLLDEPDYGLEPEGRPWLAALVRAYAAQGRCVLLTGQNTDAMLGCADRILVMDAGRLAGQRAARQAARELAGDCVLVRTPQVLRLAAILVAAGAEPTQLDGACLEVRGLDRARIGDLAFRNEVPLHELSVRTRGEDPVVAVLEACRRPPTVVPVQTPPAVRVPDAAQAVVRMPFETEVVSGPASRVVRVSAAPVPAPAPNAENQESAGPETSAATPHADAPTQMISVTAHASEAGSESGGGGTASDDARSHSGDDVAAAAAGAAADSNVAADVNTNANANVNTNAHADPDSDSDTDPDSGTDSDTDADSDSNAEPASVFASSPESVQ
jgi:ABC-2 type transport system ATP-binding protein